MKTEIKDKWLYDIFLNDCIVGNQGDYVFDTKEEAEVDANDYIENALCEEYGVSGDDFVIECYKARVLDIE